MEALSVLSLCDWYPSLFLPQNPQKSLRRSISVFLQILAMITIKVYACERCHSPCLQAAGWTTRLNLCYPVSEPHPTHPHTPQSLHYPCRLLLNRCVLVSQLLKHTQVFVIIHTVLKCQLLNHSLDVWEPLYLFILTYHFSLYGSVNVQSFPLHLLYTTFRVHQSMNPWCCSSLNGWPTAGSPSTMIETCSLMKGRPAERAGMLTNDLRSDAAAGRGACGARDACWKLWIYR